MNNPSILIGISVLLTAVLFGLYVSWRRRRPDALSAEAVRGLTRRLRGWFAAGLHLIRRTKIPRSAEILAGTVRCEPAEIRRFFGMELILGTALAILSMFLFSDIKDPNKQWIALVFLAAGLWMVGAAVYNGGRLERAGVEERAAGWLAFWLGWDLSETACGFAAAVFLGLAAAADGVYIRNTGEIVKGSALVLAILFIGSAVWRNRVRIRGDVAG